MNCEARNVIIHQSNILILIANRYIAVQIHFNVKYSIYNTFPLVSLI